MVTTLFYEVQLTDHNGNKITANGDFVVTARGNPTKLVVYNRDQDVIDVSTTKAVQIKSGVLSFGVLDTNLSVDVFGLTDDGYPFQIIGLVPGNTNFTIDLGQLRNQLVIPFTGAEYGTTATDTGFPYLANVLWDSINGGLNITTVGSSSTLAIGISGTAAGLCAALATTTAGIIKTATSSLSGAKGTGVNILFTTVSPTVEKGYWYCPIVRPLPAL
jgi:hypothetical protein